MAISRMQQPRQMYGLGSFVKKAVRKVTRPFTKVAKKLVPKEIAGIMRTAAPFLPPGYREAAYLLGTAKQTGRISPMDLALTAAPTFFSKTDMGRGIAQRVGDFTLPGMETNLRELTLGAPEVKGINESIQASPMGRTTVLEGVGAKDATSGIFGKGGEMFQFGGDQSIFDTKAGQTLFGKEKDDGTFGISLPKAAAFGTGILSAVTAAKTPEEAGNALVAQTGNSDDYERGVQLFSALPKGIFDIQNPYRLNSANGGLMRTNYAQGTLNPQVSDLFAGMRPEKPDFFEDLFLKREGGGGRDFMIPERAADFKKYYKDDGGFGVLDAPEGVNIFTGADQAKKINLDMAKELEAERILPSLNAMYSSVVDKILDIDDEETKQKMMNDVNNSFDITEGSGFQKAANAYYRIIQKYGYLLDDKKRGLMEDPQNKANGGLMRTNYAMGPDERGVVNPFLPKPQGPVLPDEDKPFTPKPKPSKMADMKSYSDYYKNLDLEKALRTFRMLKERDPEDMEELIQFFKDRKMDAAEGGLMRENFALGTRPTEQESGLGGLPIEADMRYTGGFMPYGEVEKADDVPARLSKNEFVFTADAVRAAGGGSVNEGAKKMYQAMKQLEKKPEAKGMMA